MLNEKLFCPRKFYLSTLIMSGLMVSQPASAMESWERLYQMMKNTHLTTTSTTTTTTTTT